MHHHGAVVDPQPLADRRTHDEHGSQVTARLDELTDGDLYGLEQGVLQEQVVDRVAGESQLGEDRDGDAVVVARRASASTVCALACGSAIFTGTVQAAMRANPCA